METKTIQREDLYRQVWSQPMTKLAMKYGISDVALAKTCRKLNIPIPWRGYWRRKETGKAVKQLSLPPNSDQTKQVATIHKVHKVSKPESVQQLSEETKQEIDAVEVLEKKIKVPDRLLRPHRLFKGVLTELRSLRVDRYGAIWSGGIRQLNLRVSPESLRRALRIMSTIFYALETHGYQLVVQGEHRSSLCVRINGEPIEFGLEERFRRIECPEEKNKALEPWERERYDYIATGELFLKITEWWAGGLQKVWRDGKRAKLETCLNDFVVGLIKVAEAVKAERLKREQEHQARLEADRRRQEEERKRQEELAMRQRLEQEADSWAKAQQIRQYVAAVKELAISKHGGVQQGSQLDHWIGWASAHADCLDPLCRII